MSCQRLDALFYCLFKKAGVDLASLASMSQQQQQQAVAAAASIINNTGVGNENQMIQISTAGTGSIIMGSENIVGGVQNISNNSQQNSSSLAQWKAVMKENNNQLPDEVNEMLLNGKSIVDVQNLNSYHGNATFYSNPTNNGNNNTSNNNNNANNSSNSNNTVANAVVQQNSHHLITTVPAQVQVLVQVQVQLPQHSVNAGNSNTALLV
jgi:hypothetical protein